MLEGESSWRGGDVGQEEGCGGGDVRGGVEVEKMERRRG